MTKLMELIGLNCFGLMPIWLRIVLSILALVLISASINHFDNDEDTSIQVFFMVTVVRFILCVIDWIADVPYINLISILAVLITAVALGVKNKSILVGVTMGIDIVVVSEMVWILFQWCGMKIFAWIDKSNGS